MLVKLANETEELLDKSIELKVESVLRTARDPKPNDVLAVAPSSVTKEEPAPTINVLSVGLRLLISSRLL